MVFPCFYLKPHQVQLPIVKFAEVGAVLHLGQPSVAVMGIAPILYGESSPAGRTIQTIYELLAETLFMLKFSYGGFHKWGYP